jgi:DNA repair exonuclease SbcCD ATPase subunit
MNEDFGNEELALDFPEGFEPEVQEHEDAHEYTPAQEQAVSKGWKPLEEWEGDPDDWVDAPEFNRRGELMDKIGGQSKALKKSQRELEELRKVVKDLVDHNRKISKKSVDELQKELRAQKREAEMSMDYEALDEIDDKLEELKNTRKKIDDLDGFTNDTPKDEPKIPEEVRVAAESWREHNSWYGQDVVLTGAADALANLYGQKAGEDADVEKMFRFIDESLRKEFPHKFKQTQKRANAVDTSSNTRPIINRKKARVSDLSAEQKQMAKRFEDQGVISMQEYAQQLLDAGEL